MKFKDAKYNYLAEQARPDGSFQSALILAHAQTVFKDALISHLEKQNAELAAEVERLKWDISQFQSGVYNLRCPKCKEVAGPLYPVNLCSELQDREAALACATERLDDIRNHCANSVGYKADRFIVESCEKLANEALSTPAIARFRKIQEAREKVIEACKTGKPRADIDKLITELERVEGKE